jgi:hypothetical protein
MNAQYRHSQLGYLMIICGLITIASGAIIFACGLRPLWIPIVAIGVFILVSGYKLTVEIKDGVLKLWFGPGIFWKTIPLEQIAYCEPFKGVFCGWGIRYTGDGWLYNVSGMKAVTVVLKSGKKIHIGTDELSQLVAAVNSAICGFGVNEVSPMWVEVKTDYLKRVEQALSAARHPRSFEILADVSSHMDSRFAELEPKRQTWENFQNITTEMGPPSEYAELVGQAQTPDNKGLSAGFLITLILVLAAVAAGMIILPKVLKPASASSSTSKDVMDVHGKVSEKTSKKEDDNEQKVNAAIQSAISWLHLIDEGQYEKSWQEAAAYLEKFVTQQQFKTSLEPVRKPLGKILSRKVINSTYKTALPGAPDGQYVIIQFETSFENKHNAIETVTPMMEPDGQWRVSGYYIK